MEIIRLFKNKILIYLLTRYGTYALQFVISMIIAAKLGPYYLGIYGFVTLIINYFSQINFGIPHSLNVLLVHNKNDEEKCKDYIGNSVAIYSIVAIVIVCIYIYIVLSNTQVSEKFPLSSVHVLLIMVIAIIQYYASLCTTVLRVKNRVNQLAIAQSSLVFLNLCVLPFFKDGSLIYALLVCQLISFSIFILFVYREKLFPCLRDVSYKFLIQKEILKKGLFLFLYNSCFYFITISVRSIISANYSVEEFGLFNFSFTLAHAILLLIEALMMIIFPKIIELLSSKDYKKIDTTIEMIRVSFVSTSHLLVYLAMMFFPLVTALIPKFNGALISMNLIALSVLMNTNSYGYSSFLIAQNKEKSSACISFIALLINVLIALSLVHVFDVGFSYVILSVMVTYLCFSLMTYIESKRVMGTLNWKDVLVNFFPLKLLIPFIVALVVSALNLQNLIILPPILFIIINLKDLKEIIALGRRILRNPNIADV